MLLKRRLDIADIMMQDIGAWYSVLADLLSPTFDLGALTLSRIGKASSCWYRTHDLSWWYLLLLNSLRTAGGCYARKTSVDPASGWAWARRLTRCCCRTWSLLSSWGPLPQKRSPRRACSLGDRRAPLRPRIGPGRRSSVRDSPVGELRRRRGERTWRREAPSRAAGLGRTRTSPTPCPPSALWRMRGRLRKLGKVGSPFHLIPMGW